MGNVFPTTSTQNNLENLAVVPVQLAALNRRFLGWIRFRRALPTTNRTDATPQNIRLWENHYPRAAGSDSDQAYRPAAEQDDRPAGSPAGMSGDRQAEKQVMATQRESVAARVDRLWRIWRRAPQSYAGGLAREELLESCLPLVRAVTRQVASTVADMPRCDLQQEGFLGLCAAVESFDPARGVPFPAHASLRIMGAARDAARRWRRQSPRRVVETARAGGWSPRAAFAAAVIRQDDLLARLERGLCPRRRLILHLCILQDTPCRQVAPRLGLHASRVAQIQRQMLNTWRRDPRIAALLGVRPAAKVHLPT